MNGMVSDDAYDENRERQEAEFEFIQAAYSPEEAWVTVEEHGNGCGDENDVNRETKSSIRRLFELPIGSDNSASDPLSACIPVELVLTLPPSYPTDDRAILEVDAFLSHTRKATSTSTNTSTTKPSASYRKYAIDALPDLLRACRTVATEYAGSESVFLVLSRAEMWIDEEWPNYCLGTTTRSSEFNSGALSTTSIAMKNTAEKFETTKPTVLGRKLIFSHHIIAKSKRKAVGDLAKDYKLGGYFKIGWPGIIIIEGREEDCQSFYDEIRRLRWQHLVLRGEDREEIAPDDKTTDLDDLRRFPVIMKELGEDKMSHLSEVCRKAGLHDLFLTSMKIYKHGSDGGDETGENLEAPQMKEDLRHGTLVLVDHMNGPKGYIKWLQKACKSAGCSCIVHHCFLNDDGSGEDHSGNQSHPRATTRPRARPIIIVGLIGDDESSLKQVLKRWRTSRVDVDSKGNPCLERMMDVLVEGALELSSSNDDNDDDSSVGRILMESSSGDGRVTQSELESILKTVGGSLWAGAFRDAIQNRQRSL
jgi:hypothetical protein